MIENKIKINPKIIEEFSKLTATDCIVYRKITIQDNKGRKQKYLTHNQVCTCIIRIIETCKYINTLDLKKENQFGQAFNFYEFVNCCSIVYECINTLFNIFHQKLETFYGKTKVFTKSNKTKTNDIKFFKFIRSASAVHPEHTDRYNKITKLKHEFYPYAIWNIDKNMFFLHKNSPKDFDIGLVSWNSKPTCYNKHYYLYINEFYEFTNEIISCLIYLIPVVNNLIEIDKEKRRCKRLKK